jgi:uncharacterized phage-associated protein
MDVKNVAEYIIYKSSIDDEPITNLKLQKLLYYSQGFHLAINNQALFDDPIYKWTHGPVVPSIYHQYKEFGSNPITPLLEFDKSNFPEENISLIDEVYSVFGQFSGSALRNMSHDEPPWRDTNDACEIAKANLKKYFKTRLVNK